ncbi:hypothetical protein [Streptomyces sp. NPDC055060]
MSILRTPSGAEPRTEAEDNAGTRTVVVAGHTKIGRATFAGIRPTVGVHTPVTDSGALGDELAAMGVRVTVV